MGFLDVPRELRDIRELPRGPFKQESAALARLNRDSWMGQRMAPVLDYVARLEARVAELEGGSSDRPVDEAQYLVVISGEGNASWLCRGWSHVLETIRDALWIDGEAPGDEWHEWLARLDAEDNWTHYGNSMEKEDRFHLSDEVGECSRLYIYKIQKAE